MKFTKRMWLICLFSALFLLAAGAAGFARGCFPKSLSFVPNGAEPESGYLFAQQGAYAVSSHRFADGAGWFTYYFTFSSSVQEATGAFDIQNEYKLEISTDNAAWQLVTAAPAGSRSRKKIIVPLIGENAPLPAGQTGFYLRISDSKPDDGWGPGLYKLSLDYLQEIDDYSQLKMEKVPAGGFLKTGQARFLAVRIASLDGVPAVGEPVTFALTAGGELGAALENASVSTNEFGYAAVRLTAPSAEGALGVRAEADSRITGAQQVFSLEAVKRYGQTERGIEFLVNNAPENLALEAPYLYENNDSLINGNNRYTDLNRSFTYKFDFPEDVYAVSGEFLIRNEAKVQISGDGENWHEVLKRAPGVIRDEVLNIDFTPYLSGLSTQSVYFRMSDSDPATGNGGAVARVSIAAKAYLAPSEIRMTLKGNDYNLLAGANCTVGVHLEDGNANPISGVDVAFTVRQAPASGVTIAPAQVTTDENGDATSVVTTAAEPGTIVIEARAAEAEIQDFLQEITINTAVFAVTLGKEAGDGYEVAGNRHELAVSAKGPFGEPLAGIQLSFAVRKAPGVDGFLEETSVQTDSAGKASVFYRTPSLPGESVVAVAAEEVAADNPQLVFKVMCVEPNIGGAQQLSFVPDGSPAELKYLFEQRGSTLASGKRFADANGFFTYRFQLEEVFDAALDLTLSGQYKVELSTDNAGWQLLFAGDPNMKEVGPQVAKSVASLKELAGDLSTFYLRISDLEPADGWGGAVHKLSLSYVTLQPTGIVAGIVCDQSGNPLDGVSVILGNKYLRRTDAAGAFIFSAFPAGSYSLTLQKAGWQTYVLPESFQLEAGRAKNFALSLELAQDGQPPAAPEEISVDTALAGVAIVSWHPAAVGAPAAFYNVYRAASQEPPSLAAYSLTDTRWIDYDVEQGREYAYIVTALDSAGRESEGRSSAAVRISSIAVPGLIEPRESIAEAGDVTFKWGEVADAAAYELMIADNAQFAEPQVIQAQTASQTVSLSGGVWYWKVRAVNSVGKKGPCSLPAKFAIAGGSADALSIAQLLTSPNPFSFNQNKMRITFQITQEAKVKLRIYSLSGRLVQDYPAEQLQAGVNTFEWDGRTYAGEKVPTGAYILFIQADSTALEKGSKVELKKLLTVVH